jgi:hypothetical protein
MFIYRKYKSNPAKLTALKIPVTVHDEKYISVLISLRLRHIGQGFQRKLQIFICFYLMLCVSTSNDELIERKSKTFDFSIMQEPMKRVPRIFLGGKGRPTLKADNLTAICDPTV